MKNEFEQISVKPGFMKHNGGLLFKNISENEYQFKTVIKENHLNAAGITHGGFLAAVVDAGAGTAAHRTANRRSIRQQHPNPAIPVCARVPMKHKKPKREAICYQTCM